MRLTGRRPAVTGPLLASALFAATAACTALAGVGNFEIDACFDGCDSGRGPSSTPDAPAADTQFSPPEGATPDTSSPADVSLDTTGCACPTGTSSVNGKCAVTVPPDPPPSAACKSPLQLPDCGIVVVLHVCDSYAPFAISSSAPQCKGSEGLASRPTGFVRLGKSPKGNRWKIVIHGAYSVSSPTALCDFGTIPCFADGTVSQTIESSTVVDYAELAIGKTTAVSGCQDIQVDVTPN